MNVWLTYLSLRYSVYALAGGYCVAELVEKMGNEMHNPFGGL